MRPFKSAYIEADRPAAERAYGPERYSRGEERSSAAQTWPARSSKGGKGERRAMEGQAGASRAEGETRGRDAHLVWRGNATKKAPWGRED